jgi:hypothetical protein
MTNTTSPDFSEYVDLTIYDTNAETLLNKILTYSRSVIPEWTPSAGEVEMMLAEVFAVGSADLAAYINRVPEGVLEGLISLFGVTRSDGTKATGAVEFTFLDAATIPAGTSVAYTGGSVPYVFVTDSVVSVSAAGTASSNVTASLVGTGPNTVPLGAAVQLVANIPNVLSAAVTTAPTGGTDFETDQNFFARISNTLSSYSSALVTPNQIRAAILDNFPATVYRCVVYDKERYLDRARSSDVEHAGYVLIALGKQNSDNSTGNFTDVSLSASEISDVRAFVEARVPAGLQLDFMSTELVSVSVTCTVKALENNDLGVVQTAVESALNAYLDPNVWSLRSDRVRVNEIIAVIDNTPGVDYVLGDPVLSLAGTAELGSSNFQINGVTGDIELLNLGTLVGNNGTHSIAVV